MPKLTKDAPQPLFGLLRSIVARCLVDQPTGHVYNIRATICLLSFRPFTIDEKKRKLKRKKERERRTDKKSNEKKRENRGSTGIGYKLLRPVKRKAPRGPCE